MSSLPVRVFKSTATSFTQALTEHGIQFSRRFQLANGAITSGWLIEVFSIAKESGPWALLAAAIISWLKIHRSGKVSIKMQDKSEINIEGLSATEISKVLAQAKEIIVNQSDQDNV